MRELEDEFVNDAVCSHSARDEGELGVVWVAEDEMMRVKGCETFFSYAAAVFSSAYLFLFDSLSSRWKFWNVKKHSRSMLLSAYKPSTKSTRQGSKETNTYVMVGI